MSINGASVMAAAVVAVDVGKNRAALSVTDARWGSRLRRFTPIEYEQAHYAALKPEMQPT